MSRRIFSFTLLSVVIIGLLNPVASNRAYGFGAFGIVHDPIHTGVSLKTIFFEALNAIAIQAANAAVQQIVNSSIEWAQNGFEGNPAYAVDPKQYFTNIADGTVGEFIGSQDSPLNFLCSPFQTQIRLALQRQYIQPVNYQCTLTQVVGNIDSFYNNFQDGGWDAWISMTQNDANNPYGAYLEAKLDLDSRVARAVGLQNDELDRNQGFLDFKYCEKTNPPMRLPAVQGPIEDPANPDAPPLVNVGGGINPEHVPGKAVGECIEYGATKTPGSIIKSQLDKVLPAGLEKVTNLIRVEQLINAFSTGLLRRYVFGNQGLFARGSSLPTDAGSNPRNPGGVPQAVGIDIDTDGKNDIIDTNNDGDPDACVYGGEYPNCTLSSVAPAPSAGPASNNPNFPDVNDGGTATVTGWVFIDENRNGSRDNGEVGLSGVSARILDQVERRLGSASTSGEETYLGQFVFRGLTYGTKPYLVEISVPSGYTNTSPVRVSSYATYNQIFFGIAPTQ